MADQLCTSAQIKARVEVTDAADDALIVELIEEVTDWIQGHIHRRLLPDNAATYILDTSAGSVIDIPRGIRAVTTLEVATSDQPDTGGTYTAIAAADILLRPSPINRRPGWPATSILIRQSGIGRLVQALNGARIVGDFDFAATPPAAQGVAIDAVVTAFVARQGGASDTIGGDSTAIYPWARYFTDGSPQLAVLDRYRINASPGIG
jgi:hypothetical protein